VENHFKPLEPPDSFDVVASDGWLGKAIVYGREKVASGLWFWTNRIWNLCGRRFPRFNFEEGRPAFRLLGMKIRELTIGLKIKHPQYGLGIVQALNEHTAEIRFGEGTRTIEPEMSGVTPGEPTASVSGLAIPLKQFVATTIQGMVDQLGIERPEAVVEQLGTRWHGGKLVLHPADASLQTKEIPLEVFFHKIVGLRNQLRVLEQKINADEKLTDGEKVERQQYITRCYGSLTTFNILFKNKEDQF
jgi:hypothetical protein